MTATLTDLAPFPHSGDAMALDPMATVRREYAATLAETRLWGNSSYVPGQGNRRMVAKGETILMDNDYDPPAPVTVATYSDPHGNVSRYLI